MANLTGQQINNTYQGLLKTENNGAIGSVPYKLTDGLGNQTGIQLDPGQNGPAYVETKFQLEGWNTQNLLKNVYLDRTQYPMNPFTASTKLRYTDTNDALTYQIAQNQYGSVEYAHVHGGANNQQHIFQGFDGSGNLTNTKISINAWNGVNNSDNWITAYNERITAGSFDNGTRDLTLTRPSATDIVVNIPGGSGGAAGLVSGTGTDSMVSAASLTTNAATAPTTDAIAIGNGATIAPAVPARPSWGTLGHIAIGAGINVVEGNSFGDFYSKAVVAIGRNASVNPFYDGGNVAIGDGASSTNMHGIALGAATTAHQFCVAIGQNAEALVESSFSLGRNSQALKLNSVALGASAFANGTNSVAIGQGATAEGDTSISIGDGNTNQNGPNLSVGRANNNLGNGSTIIGTGNTMGLNNGNCYLLANNINVAAGTNDYIAIGRINNPSGNVNNSVQIGLVSQITASQNSVAIGRSSSVVNASNSVAIGRGASATTGNSVALGYNVTATKSDTVTVNELALTTTGGGITMISPNGTEYKLTVSDAGALIIT
jgi:hypothetical protein